MLKRIAAISVCLTVSVIFVSGCRVETCIAGRTEICVCADGRNGAQICGKDGAFAACSCTFSPFDTGDTATDSGGNDATVKADASEKSDVGIGSDSGKHDGASTVDATIIDASDTSKADASGEDIKAVDTGPSVPELCNGKDDDGDSAIDEWDGTHNPTCQSTIAAGVVNIGCAPKDKNCDSDEKPLHKVMLSAFAIDRTEVTQAAWAACVKAGACSEPSSSYSPLKEPNHPITKITWKAADHYCKWRGLRLPTELEWERAARGTDLRIWPWGDATPIGCAQANFVGCGDASSAVGSFPIGVSAEGVYDLAGNVAEWTADLYDSSAWKDHAAGVANPPAPKEGKDRVFRGGSYYYSAIKARCSDRHTEDPLKAYSDLGFRCARSLP
jgi:formylglycine-generating enzyme